MKKLNLLTALSIAVLVLSACKKDDPTPTPEPTPTDTSGNKVITQNISYNTSWTNDNVYQLGGRIVVTDGATLTIEKGTVIKGEAGVGANATALIVTLDGKIIY